MNGLRQFRRFSEAGVTLVELLVVVTILGVIGGIATAGIVTALQSARTTTARVDALQELEIGAQRIVREIRAAQGLILAGVPGDGPGAFEQRLGAEVLRDGVESEVEFFLDPAEPEDGELVRLISQTGGSEQVLITLVNLDGEDPIFRYLDTRGEEIQCVDNCAAAYAQAARVEIVLRRNVEDGRPPVTVRTQAAIRNIRYPVVIS